MNNSTETPDLRCETQAGAATSARVAWRSLLCFMALGIAACQPDTISVPSSASHSGFSSQSVAGEDSPLFTAIAESGLTSQQNTRLARVRRKSQHTHVRVGRLNQQANALLRKGTRLTLPLSDALTVTATGQREVRRSDGKVSWAGPLDGTAGWAQLVLGPAGIYGMVSSGIGRYWIEPIGNGLHAIATVDDSKFIEHAADAPTGASIDIGAQAEAEAKAKAAASGLQTFDIKAFHALKPATRALFTYTAANTPGDVDVVVGYTAAAAAATADIESLALLAVDNATQSYWNSGVSLTMSLVYAGQISYTESGNTPAQHLSFAMGSSTLASLRNQYYGDVVALLIDDSSECGRAAGLGVSASQAYVTADQGCAAANYTLAHEVGHLVGARHNMGNDPTTTPLAYVHGYQIPDVMRTIMAYPCEIAHPCPREAVWSGFQVPWITHGSYAYEHNERLLDETKAALTSFREPLSVVINGPSTVMSTQLNCSWSATTSGNVPVASYSWSGVLSGSSDPITGSVGSSGYLYVTVYDSFGRYTTNSFYVTVDNNGPGC